jgi:putative peptidoglycan lipid II flippase
LVGQPFPAHPPGAADASARGDVTTDARAATPEQRAGLVRSSAVVATGTLLSRITGLLRVVVLAAVIGQATLADAYNLANTTPNIIYELLLGGVLAATLVPVFVDRIEHRDDRSTSAIFTVSMTALVIFTAVTLLFTPLLARAFAIGSSGAEHAAQVHVLTVLIVCFVPQMVFYGFTTLATALLNAHRRFAAAAFAPVLNNVVVIIMLLAFAVKSGSQHGVTDAAKITGDLDLLLLLGLGTTAGIVAMALALVPAIARAGIRLRPVFDWRDSGIRTIVRLSGWTAGYVITNQIAQLFVLVLAKSGTAGNVSAYTYAFTFYVVPYGLLAVSIMTTIMPELARRVTANDFAGLRRDFNLGLRYIIVLVLPASVLFVVLAQPMLAIIVRDQFTAHDAAVTADTLQLFALSLVPFSVYLYTMRGFYALHDTRTPFIINAFENALNIVLALALFPSLGVQGLAIAWGIAYAIAAVVALIALRRRIPGVPDTASRHTLVRAILGGIALAVVAAPLAAAIGHADAVHALAATLIAALAGAGVYLLVQAALRADELSALVTLVRRRGIPVDNVSP